MPGRVREMTSAASMPEPSGMCTSRRTASGFISRALSAASTPVETAATTSWPSAMRTSVSVPREPASSSARRIRSLVLMS